MSIKDDEMLFIVGDKNITLNALGALRLEIARNLIDKNKWSPYGSLIFH